VATRKKTGFKISFDSPITLIFVILCVIFGILSKFLPEFQNFLTCPTSASGENPFNFKSVTDYFRLLLYPLGVLDWNILTSNLVFILLLCPKIEEKFGKGILSLLILITVLFAGVVCVCFSSTVMVGSSGIVCMLLILSFYCSIDKKEIPLSYILLALIYFSTQLISVFTTNSLEPFCHFAGALIGSLVGILSLGNKN